MNFSDLQRRLLDAVRERVRCGEWTERGLAKHLGLSQPHVHNLLKGRRLLTSAVADLLLAKLNLGLDQLAPAGLAAPVPLPPEYGSGPLQCAAVARGYLGPEHAWLAANEENERIWVPRRLLSAVTEPLLARLGPDVGFDPLRGGGIALLEQSLTARAEALPGRWYALNWEGRGYLRRIRVESGLVIVLGQLAFTPEWAPPEIRLDGRPLPAVVSGRLEWCGAAPQDGNWGGAMPAASW